jgi:hypothetical protein
MYLVTLRSHNIYYAGVVILTISNRDWMGMLPINVFRLDKFLSISFLMVIPIAKIGEDAQNPFLYIKFIVFFCHRTSGSRTFSLAFNFSWNSFAVIFFTTIVCTSISKTTIIPFQMNHHMKKPLQ